MAGFDFTEPHNFDAQDGETLCGDVFVSECDTETILLGPDGLPYQYEKIAVGFILPHRRNKSDR